MMLLLGVIGVCALFCAIYIAILVLDRPDPRCPECGAEMTHYDDDKDENDRDIWTCPRCGTKTLL